MKYLPDSSSETALLSVTQMLSVGTNVAFGIVFLLIVLVAIRRRRPDAWRLLFASATLTLVTALAGPVSQLWRTPIKTGWPPHRRSPCAW